MFADSILFKKLEERSPKKAELIKEVYEKFKDKIEAIRNLFSDFTDHDISHCESVVRSLEELVIGKDLLENSEWKKVRGEWRLYLKDNAYLTEDEIAILFLAILLHDIGMSPKIDDKLKELLGKAKCGEVKKDELKEIKLIVRETHHIRSKEFIESNKDLKDLMEEYSFDKYIEALADIVEGHRIDPCDLFNKSKKVYDVRVPLLAFLLEIADDMDIGSHRVDRFISEDWIWFYLNKENIKHILANMSVEKSYRDGDRVEYEVYIKDLEKYSFILELVYNKWWVKIENRIDRFGLVGVFSEKEDIIAWRYVLPSKVEFKIKAEGIDADWSKKFEVDRRVFADLLSSRVYGNRWEYAFRELIANCFDAIKMRAYEDDTFDNPKVKIDVRFVGDRVEITIEDNGIGMNLRDIEDYLLKVGRSFYSELKDFEKAKAINPIGYYGIGFLSSFMLLRNDKGEFEGSIEVETKKNGYDAVKVLILNPNLPVIKFKSDKDKVGTVIKIKCRNREVKEFFECILEFVKLCKANGVDVNVFPFFEIRCSVFEIDDRKLEIPIVIKIEDVEIWNGYIKAELFIDGEKFKEVDVKHESGDYKLEIWKGLSKYLYKYAEIFDYKILIPINQLNDLLRVTTEVVEDVFPIYKLRSKNNKLMLSVGVNREFISSVNGIACDLENNEHFEVFSVSKIDNEQITLILNMNLRNPNYIDLKKTKIEIPKDVLRELFKKLKDGGVVLYLTYVPSRVDDIDFKEIGAIDFVKSCFKFEILYGDFLTLDEIKKMGKEPVVVDVKIIENLKDECKNLWNKLRLVPLSRKYNDFLRTTCRRVSDYIFKRCEKCKSKSNDCVFKWKGYYITKSDFRDLCLRKDILVVEIEAEIQKEKDVGVVHVVYEHCFILDNPFVKAICEMWKNKEITLDELKPIFEETYWIVGRKSYATVKDIENLANEDENIKRCYELIKKWMKKQKQS